MRKQAILLVLLFYISTFYVQTSAVSPSLLITEVLYDTPGTDSIEEWVEIYNPTGSTIDLTGWTLNDNSGTFTLSGSITAGAYITVARDTAGFNALYGFNPTITGMNLALGNSGDRAQLKDNSATLIDEVG